MAAKEIASKALQGLHMTSTEDDAQFTWESQKQMYAALMAIRGPTIIIMRDDIVNEHGRFISPEGRGFTKEELQQVWSGTYATAATGKAK